jgi:hypothetical protein
VPAIAGIRTWIVSAEDLILSKLAWALDSNSELQRRDIRQLLAGAIDLDYIRQWAPQLGVTTLLNGGELPEAALIAHARYVSETRA